MASLRSPKSERIKTALYCMCGAFTTYCSMYAFRKPFTAGMYEGLSLWDIDYKIVLITTQVLGYMLSKFMGIKWVSEMTVQDSGEIVKLQTPKNILTQRFLNYLDGSRDSNYS